jgi:hypothetical protein
MWSWCDVVEIRLAAAHILPPRIVCGCYPVLSMSHDNLRPSPMKLQHFAGILLLSFALGGCDFQKEADARFGDQHFKTAISLVELHKVRTGAYPQKLSDLTFIGEWDAIALNSVEYKQLATGYELNVTRGWVGQPELVYPKEFWQGLGLVKSNLKPGA